MYYGALPFNTRRLYLDCVLGRCVGRGESEVGNDAMKLLLALMHRIFDVPDAFDLDGPYYE